MIWQPDSVEFRAMLRAYMHCLLWTMPGPDGDENPGDRFTPERFTRPARDTCMADCLEFLNRCQRAQLSPWFWQTVDSYTMQGEFGPDRFGHDLALSRNGHGAGFFDRRELERNAYPDGLRKPAELGEALQEIASSMGERDIYPARGWIHCS